MPLLRKICAGVGFTTIGAGVFGGIVYQRRLKENKCVTADDYNAKQNQEELQQAFRLLRTRDSPEVLLYRYTTCPFCGKVKAFLDFHKIQHTCVEVDPMVKSQIATSEYKKVPQLRFNVSGHHGPYLVDSDRIIETLAPVVGVEKQLKDPEVQKWRDWARESLVKHLVVNLNETLVGAWQGYDYIDNFDTIPATNKLFLKVMGAPVMYLVSRYKTVPTLVANGELRDEDDRREVLHHQLQRFISAGLGTKQFHGGATPDLADIDVYGVMQSLRGHAIYDDMLTEPGLRPWVDRMDLATGKAPY